MSVRGVTSKVRLHACVCLLSSCRLIQVNDGKQILIGVLGASCKEHFDTADAAPVACEVATQCIKHGLLQHPDSLELQRHVITNSARQVIDTTAYRDTPLTDLLLLPEFCKFFYTAQPFCTPEAYVGVHIQLLVADPAEALKKLLPTVPWGTPQPAASAEPAHTPSPVGNDAPSPSAPIPSDPNHPAALAYGPVSSSAPLAQPTHPDSLPDLPVHSTTALASASPPADIPTNVPRPPSAQSNSLIGPYPALGFFPAQAVRLTSTLDCSQAPAVGPNPALSSASALVGSLARTSGPCMQT